VALGIDLRDATCRKIAQPELKADGHSQDSAASSIKSLQDSLELRQAWQHARSRRLAAALVASVRSM
jgi:hypothetical protein